MGIEKPLKIDSGGKKAQLDPATDTVAAQAIAFEGLSTFLAEKVGSILGFRKPDFSAASNFNSDGTLNFVEFFQGAVQTTPNRRMRVDMSYDGDLNPSTEIWRIYSPLDGTTILRTVTYTFTFSSGVLTNIVEATA